MDTYAKLKEEKNNILSRISKAASDGQTNLVLSESENLRKIELLLDRHQNIILELEELKSGESLADESRSPLMQRDSTKVSVTLASTLMSSRKAGDKMRERFLSNIGKVGISLALVKGKTIYNTKSGKRVGIAVATERNPDRWFLGLPAGGFDHAVLLCQPEKGEIIEVLLTEKFFTKYTLGQSKGQIKFNVVRRGGKVILLIPGTNGVSNSFFASDYSFLG